MKRISLLLLAGVISLASMAQTKVFNEAAAVNGVTSVYISPSILKLGTDVGRLGHGLDDAVSELTGLEVLTTEYDEVRYRKVRELCNNVIKMMTLELMVDVNEDNEKVKLYADLEPESSFANKIVLEIDKEPSNYTVIYVSGKIDISKLIKDNLNFR